MHQKSSNPNIINFHDLHELTVKLLDEIISVFSVNCIYPWSNKTSDELYIGYIKYTSFVPVSRQLGLVFTASEQRSIEKHFRDHNLEYIDIDSFVQLVDNKIKLDNKINIEVPKFSPLNDYFNTKLEECYDILDWQKSAKLPTSDMKHMLSCFNDGEFDNNTLNLLFRSANLTNKRIVSKDDFKQMFLPVSDTSFFSLRLFENAK